MAWRILGIQVIAKTQFDSDGKIDMTTTGIDAAQIAEPAEEDYLEDARKSLAGPDLFSTIETGLHDGFLVDDLGWALFSIREKLGIEPMVALATRGSAESYFDWMQSKVGASLSDWEPVKLPLFQAWITTCADMSPEGLAFSYRVWRHSSKNFDAVAIRPVDVFALRHHAWPLLAQERVREFNVAMQRSHMKARWSRTNPGREMVPEDMDGDAGFVVSGRPRGKERQVRLTWPVADIGEVIRQAEALKKSRVADLVILEGGSVGFPFNKRTYQQWMHIAELDRSWGNNGMLLDLGRSVGMCSW